MAIVQSFFGSLLPFPSQTWLSLCMVLRTITFLFFFGRYDTMVQSSEKANVEEFNFLPCSCSSSLGSSGFSTPCEYA
ncbi:hypothetical protein T12_4392, partial [Trichinella patagoniensis]